MFNFMVTNEGGLTTAGYAIAIIAGILLFLAAIYFAGKHSEKHKLTTRQLVFCAVAMALAFVTSYLKIFKLPWGGSVTLCSMLFIVLIGYWYGLGAGLTTAIAYGFLQLIIDPYILSVPQMLVDYIFAFGALGLAGIFWKNKSKYAVIFCYIAGVLGRYVFAFISGWIFFGMYAADYGF